MKTYTPIEPAKIEDHGDSKLTILIICLLLVALAIIWYLYLSQTTTLKSLNDDTLTKDREITSLKEELNSIEVPEPPREIQYKQVEYDNCPTQDNGSPVTENGTYTLSFEYPDTVSMDSSMQYSFDSSEFTENSVCDFTFYYMDYVLTVRNFDINLGSDTAFYANKPYGDVVTLGAKTFSRGLRSFVGINDLSYYRELDSTVCEQSSVNEFTGFPCVTSEIPHDSNSTAEVYYLYLLPRKVDGEYGGNLPTKVGFEEEILEEEVLPVFDDIVLSFESVFNDDAVEKDNVEEE